MLLSRLLSVIPYSAVEDSKLRVWYCIDSGVL